MHPACTTVYPIFSVCVCVLVAAASTTLEDSAITEISPKYSALTILAYFRVLLCFLPVEMHVQFGCYTVCWGVIRGTQTLAAPLVTAAIIEEALVWVQTGYSLLSEFVQAFRSGQVANIPLFNKPSFFFGYAILCIKLPA